MNNIPAHGTVITFSRKPAGSYASVGVSYRVARYGKTINLTNIETGAQTQDRVAMYGAAQWKVA